jgi:hypothetical protein
MWAGEAACGKLNKLIEDARNYTKIIELHGKRAKFLEVFEEAFAPVQDFDGEEEVARVNGVCET